MLLEFCSATPIGISTSSSSFLAAHANYEIRPKSWHEWIKLFSYVIIETD